MTLIAQQSPETSGQSPREQERRLLLVVNNRQPSAPTPLEAWSLETVEKIEDPATHEVYEQFGVYYPRSNGVFEARLAAAQKDKEPEWRIDLAGISLTGLHTMRCDQNSLAMDAHKKFATGKQLSKSDKDLIWKAQVGEAKMDDILELLARPLGFTALEGLKFSSWRAENVEETLENMSQAVQLAVVKRRDPCAQMPPRNPNIRYAHYRASYSEDELAVNGLLMARKQDLAILPRDQIRIIERTSWILDFNHLHESGHFPRLLQKASQCLLSPSGTEDKVSECLARAGVLLEDAFTNNSDWAIRMTTSIYAARMDQKGISSQTSKKKFFPIQVVA